MRVVTGTAKGRNLIAPPGTDTRPTSAVVKEAVFSVIQFEVEGANVLDLFAGSGQMGIEALSRGAKHCVFVEKAKAAQGVLRENLEKTGLRARSRVVNGDAVGYLRAGVGPFDIAFLDPPYQDGLLVKSLKQCAAAMSECGVMICESDRREELPEAVGELVLHKSYRYGKTKVTIYRRPAPDEE